MKKILTSVLAVVIGLCGIAVFSACPVKTYTIKYTIDGVERTDGVPTSYQAYPKQEVALWMPDAPDGKFFDGWHARADFSDPSIMDSIPAQSIGDRHFYGRFLDEAYSITYTVDGVLMADGEPSSYKPLQSTVTLWTPEAPDDNSVFDGWYEDADFTTAKTTQIPLTEMEDKQYFGRFVSKTGASSIRYFIDKTHEVTAKSTLKFYTKSENATTLWIPAYNQKLLKFVGWYEDAAFSGPQVTEIPANTEGDKIYYGYYTEPDGYDLTRTKATSFTVTGGNNGTKSLSSFYGKPVVINFWSTGCGPCLNEMPYFQKLYTEMRDDVEFVMIETGGFGENANTIRNFISSNNYTFTYYIDLDAVVYNQYRLSGGIPVTVFIDRWGYSVRTQVGEFISEAQLRSEISKIYSGSIY